MKFNPKHNAFTASRFLTWQVGRRWNVGSHVGLSISSLVSAGSASWTRTQGTVAFWVLVWGIAFLFVSSGCEQMLWSFVWNPLIFLGLLSHLYGSKVKFVQFKKSKLVLRKEYSLIWKSASPLCCLPILSSPEATSFKYFYWSFSICLCISK